MILPLTSKCHWSPGVIPRCSTSSREYGVWARKTVRKPLRFVYDAGGRPAVDRVTVKLYSFGVTLGNG